MDTLPLELLVRICDYVPRDSNQRSPTAPHIRSLLHYYNYDYEEIYRLIREYEEQHGLDDVPPRMQYYEELFYEPEPNEEFYKYVLRINKMEKEDIDQAEIRYYNDIINCARYYTTYEPDTDSESDTS